MLNWKQGMLRLWALSSTVWALAGLFWIPGAFNGGAAQTTMLLAPPVLTILGYFGGRWILLGFLGKPKAVDAS